MINQGYIEWNGSEHIKGPHKTSRGFVMTRHIGHRSVTVDSQEYMYDSFTFYHDGEDTTVLGNDLYVYVILRRRGENRVKVRQLGRLEDVPREIGSAILADSSGYF